MTLPREICRLEEEEVPGKGRMKPNEKSVACQKCQLGRKRQTLTLAIFKNATQIIKLRHACEERDFRLAHTVGTKT